MRERFVGGHEPAREGQVPGLCSAPGSERDLGADAPRVAGAALEANQHGMAGAALVPVERHGLAEIGDDRIEITVAVQVGDRSTKAGAETVESPLRSRRFEAEISQISERKVLFTEDRRIPPA